MTELLNLNLYHFLMVLLRVGSALSLMPGFMTSYVNTQVKLSVALAICIVMMPVIAPHLPPQPGDVLTMFSYILSEITIGVFLGVIMQILYTSLALAGNLAGQAVGFSNAQIFDPTFQTQTIVLETFLNIVALTVIFLTDLHHLMLSAVVDSYHLFPVGSTLPWGDFAKDVSQTLNDSFVMGFKIGSPFIAFTIVFLRRYGTGLPFDASAKHLLPVIAVANLSRTRPVVSDHADDDCLVCQILRKRLTAVFALGAEYGCTGR